jgi:hypothetical protein
MTRPAAPPKELNAVLNDVAMELASMIASGHHGHVVIHYGSNQLRVEVQRNLPAVRVASGVVATTIAAG